MEKSFGQFLKEKRQEKNLTQKDLAKLLIVSPSAVSKWEKDVAHPDITLLPQLSQILGVTEHELITASVDRQYREEKKQAKKWRAISITWSLFFYIAYGVALIPCFICNLAVHKTLSWFWIVASALLLAFTFTNLPKLIKKHKLLILPLCMFLALCLLLGICNAYTNGKWFWIASLGVLLGLTTIFLPIYVAKYPVFSAIKRFNDFVSVGVCFLLLNVLLIVIDNFSVTYYNAKHWYFSVALPIVSIVYILLNLCLCTRFLKINRLLKTSLILFLFPLIYLCIPLIKVNNPYLQKEINDCNIFQANFSSWIPDTTLDNNIHCILFLTVGTLAVTFLICGLFQTMKRKNTK